MRTLNISKVSIIRRNKAGDTINIVAIRVEGKPAIIRTFDQFTTDLRESFLVSDDVTSMSDPEVLEVLADLQGGTITGIIAFHKAGDKYKIDENHAALTNPKHRLYGKVSVGQELTTEKDGSRVTEGFLTLKREVAAQVMHKSASSYAKMRLKFEGFLKKPEDAPVIDTGVEGEEFDLEADLKKEVVGEVKE